MTADLSILVVSYNTRAMTLEAIGSAIAETTAPFEIIVVDNASADGSAEAISEAYGGDPRVRLIAETENHGFARANLIAASHATGRWLVLLNPDTVVLDGAIDRLLDEARAHPDARIWGGRTVFAGGRLNPASCWGRQTLWSLFCQASGLSSVFRRTTLFNPEGYGGWDRSGARPVDIVSGCFLMIAREDWEALGGFDPAFVMYGEEADLCLRAREQLGARPRVTDAATIVHHAGASETVRADKMVRLMKAKTSLIRRHLPAWQQGMARTLLALWPWSRALAARLRGRASASDWRAVWDRRAEWRDGWPGA